MAAKYSNRFLLKLVAGCWMGVEVDETTGDVLDRLTGRYANNKAAKRRAQQALDRKVEAIEAEGLL